MLRHQYNVLIILAMTRASRGYPISHRWSIAQSLAHHWVFSLYRTNTTTHNHTSWPPPSLIPNRNVVHAPPPTRGTSTAPYALLPTWSARLLLRSLRLLWLQLVHMHLHPASIPGASSLRLLELLALTVGGVVRSLPVAVARFSRTMLLSAFDVSRSSYWIISPVLNSD